MKLFFQCWVKGRRHPGELQPVRTHLLDCTHVLRRRGRRGGLTSSDQKNTDECEDDPLGSGADLRASASGRNDWATHATARILGRSKETRTGGRSARTHAEEPSCSGGGVRRVAPGISKSAIHQIFTSPSRGPIVNTFSRSSAFLRPLGRRLRKQTRTRDGKRESETLFLYRWLRGPEPHGRLQIVDALIFRDASHILSVKK